MTNSKYTIGTVPGLLALLAASVAITGGTAQAAVPGITGYVSGTTESFDLVASAAYTSQPDGAMIYSWGYGCNPGFNVGTQQPGAPGFVPDPNVGTCSTMQVPGPTLVVTEGDTIQVTLHNALPSAAGNTSIVFPGFALTSQCPANQQGILTCEATPTAPVTYTFVAAKPGTYAYYSGTQADLQIEMGLFGAIIVRPNASSLAAAGCKATGKYSLAAAAYGNKNTCYDREYLFQFSEMNLEIHQAVEAAKDGPAGSLSIPTDPYQPEYFLVNGRSMPDDLDAPYASSYPHQPYNGNPQMLPGELVLMRIIGQGRMQHPFHFHGNHARVIARDANLLVTNTGNLAGPLLFTTATVPGQTQDQLFTWTGQGLNWDVYGANNGHTCSPAAGSVFDASTHEYCPDHNKPMPVQPPDPQAVANGLWYSGSPYLGYSDPTPLPPGAGAVSQNTNAAYAYMWHSHNEREITTNNVFPGGMMMMLIINPPGTVINELQ